VENNQTTTNYLITIIGATAIGKTNLSIEIAKHFKTEIMSSDSRQFYKEMNIGTAVPSLDELAAVPHHFIQNRSIFDDYNVGQFEKEALLKLEELYKNHCILVMVGGSGLYTNALINGLSYFPEVNPEIRTKLNKEIENGNLTKLQKQLKKLDIESYNTLAIDNPHRIVRALEICMGTGKPYSSFKKQTKQKRNFIPIKIGLEAPRELMYQRINKRVDIMVKEGLIKEAEKLYPHKKLNALQTVGYQELFNYFDGEYSLEFAIDEIKKNTRRFAKRQVTWNKKDTNIHWFNFNEDKKVILKQIEKLLV